MKIHPLTRRHWYIVALIAVVLGIWFVAPFMGLIALAALMAFLFRGTYTRISQYVRPSIAGAVTVVVSILVVVIPVSIIVAFTAIQLTQLATHLSHVITSDSSLWNVNTVIQNVNSFLTPVIGNAHAVSTDGVMEFLRTTLPTVLHTIASMITNVIGGIPTAIILGIMYIILLYDFLVHGTKIIGSVVALSPFQPKVTRMYLDRVGLMANAMAKGQLYISFIISLLSALILSTFLGLGDYLILMTVVFTLLNLIPLGCGIVVIPITIIAMLSGAMWPGLISLVLYMVISNLDALIRPRIIPRSITLSAGLTMLAAFGGISLFGLMGVVYGPILMIIIVTSVQMYLETYDAPTAWRRQANK
jgi:predicted PurR-regulated permease PerM